MFEEGGQFMYRSFHTIIGFFPGIDHVIDMAEYRATIVIHYLPLLIAINAQFKGHPSHYRYTFHAIFPPTESERQSLARLSEPSQPETNFILQKLKHGFRFPRIEFTYRKR